MLKSWLLLMAADGGRENPPSGAAAQQAVWPEESAVRKTVRPAMDDNEDRARKGWESGVNKTAYVFRPEKEAAFGKHMRMAGWSDDNPSCPTFDGWKAEASEPCPSC